MGCTCDNTGKCGTCKDLKKAAKAAQQPSAAEIQKLLADLEKTKPAPYCISQCHAVEPEELTDHPEDHVLIFDEAHRGFCCDLFRGWEHGGILPKLVAYIRSLEAEHRVMRSRLETDAEICELHGSNGSNAFTSSASAIRRLLASLTLNP